MRSASNLSATLIVGAAGLASGLSCASARVENVSRNIKVRANLMGEFLSCSVWGRGRGERGLAPGRSVEPRECIPSERKGQGGEASPPRKADCGASVAGPAACDARRFFDFLDKPSGAVL